MHYKENTFFKICVCLMLLVFIGQPVIALAQDSGGTEYLEGKMDGENDCRVSGAWFFAGFCGGLIGVIIAYVVKPSPSTALLTGKSQTYIMGYIDGWKSKGSSMQGKKAISGWATFCVIYLSVILALSGSSS